MAANGAAARAMELRDVENVLAIQQGSAEIAQWKREDYTRIAEAQAEGAGEAADARAWVAEDDGRIAGFIVMRRVADEVEILNLAVSQEGRRRGIGSALLRKALAYAAESGARKAYLEVRESNAAARAFYARHRFQVAGKRPQYYKSPAEAAVILVCENL